MQGYSYNSELGGKEEFLIIYDICSDKRRRKIVKLFEGYGTRVQESAFEFCVSRRQFWKLREVIPTLISDEDSVRIYLMKNSDRPICWGPNLDLISCDVFIA